jgi:hypothetical protein
MTMPITTADFHTYRVTVLGTTGTLYMDGNLIESINNPRTDVNSDQIAFGDQTGTADSDYSIEYLRGYNGGAVGVPEPATLGLLAFGGLVMLRRRGVRR